MKRQMNKRAYSKPSTKVMRMVISKSVMLETFSGGDHGNGIGIDPNPDNSGQINRSNSSSCVELF